MERLRRESLLAVLSRVNYRSLRELANEVGVSVSMVSRIFSGQREPSLSVAHRLAQAMGMSLDAFECYRKRPTGWTGQVR